MLLINTCIFFTKIKPLEGQNLTYKPHFGHPWSKRTFLPVSQRVSVFSEYVKLMIIFKTNQLLYCFYISFMSAIDIFKGTVKCTTGSQTHLSQAFNFHIFLCSNDVMQSPLTEPKNTEPEGQNKVVCNFHQCKNHKSL